MTAHDRYQIALTRLRTTREAYQRSEPHVTLLDLARAKREVLATRYDLDRATERGLREARTVLTGGAR